jgi:hypothetical protein
MAQAVEHLPSKPEALSSKPSTDKKREKKEITESQAILQT